MKRGMANREWRMRTAGLAASGHGGQQQPSTRDYKPETRKGRGFTLVEVLVALAIMMVMLVIILVPVNLGLDTFHIGNANAGLQRAADLAMAQMEKELRTAVHVFPNDALPGVTDKPPYNKPPWAVAAGKPGKPYLKLDGGTHGTNYEVQVIDGDGDFLTIWPRVGVCHADLGYVGGPYATPVGNRNRVDFLLPEAPDAMTRYAGSASDQRVRYRYVVTYYARRLDVTKPFDTYDNPIVLFRAQYRYENDNGPYPYPGAALNANLSDTFYTFNGTYFASRYETNGTGCDTSHWEGTVRGSWWLYQSVFDEPNLEPLCRLNPPIIYTGPVPTPGATPDPAAPGSHTQISPRDMAMLISPPGPAGATPTPTSTPQDLKPDTTFTLSANRAGVINRIRITLVLAKTDDNASPAREGFAGQRIRVTQEIVLPNVQ